MVLRAQTEVTQLDVAFLLDLWLGKLISGKRQEPYYVRDKGTLQFKANLWNNGIRQARKLENSVTPKERKSAIIYGKKFIVTLGLIHL